MLRFSLSFHKILLPLLKSISEGILIGELINNHSINKKQNKTKKN